MFNGEGRQNVREFFERKKKMWNIKKTEKEKEPWRNES